MLTHAWRTWLLELGIYDLRYLFKTVTNYKLENRCLYNVGKRFVYVIPLDRTSEIRQVGTIFIAIVILKLIDKVNIE